MSPLEWLAVVLGVSIVALILIALRRGEFDREAAKYEMLDMSQPAKTLTLPPGRLNPTDRIVRLGLIGACFYYAARIGWTDPVGIALAVVGAYASLTGLWGKDPLYYLWRRFANR